MMMKLVTLSEGYFDLKLMLASVVAHCSGNQKEIGC
jgi:hypothetical protein